MPGFINQINNVTVDNVTSLSTNITNYADFYININQFVYEGWLTFIILIVLGTILFLSMNKLNDDPGKNILYITTLLTVLSILIRGAYTVIGGIQYSLLTDWQLWIFPIITGILILIRWATKE